MMIMGSWISKSSQVPGTSNSQETRLDMRSNKYIRRKLAWGTIYDMGYTILFIYPLLTNSIDSPMISKYINSWGVYYQGFFAWH
jgi:hypothetical protein